MFMQLIGWMLPLGIAAIPFVANVYGPAGGWCWIPPNKHLWRLFTWYLWNTLGIALLFSMIGYSRYLLKRVSEQSYMGTWDPSFSRRKKALEQDRRTLQNYPIVYTVTGWVLIRSFSLLIKRKEDTYMYYFGMRSIKTFKVLKISSLPFFKSATSFVSWSTLAFIVFLEDLPGLTSLTGFTIIEFLLLL